ncbi:zinc-ribbon and DUF3426 domain-containing protein [Methylomonas rapida]|uniref:Zinc-ribbon and DUF3426 domain-containing protein n=1 Tax=Methylomonas rapida TaxID=2963939 RepID=A0ABY7GFK1_9GAMM|nr:zinc-ribbon and DUF3426 domain-containing protein [Methylomonas rapida]WAR44047.1 zinc-ribbon and DUF3426 domain-containing protein [Methylomonas rapida]
MFSRCPQCDVLQEVTTQQLRDSRGLLKCKACRQTFDALPTLSERPDEMIEPGHGIGPAFEKNVKTESLWLWRGASLAMLLLLMVQLAYFEGQRLYRYPLLRPALAKVCAAMDCRLIDTANTTDWSVSHSQLQPYLQQTHLLTAALTNQADVAQGFPSLQLTLTDFNGQPLEQRLFAPQQYTHTAQLAANQTMHIRLPLIIPAEFGGFTLTLI